MPAARPSFARQAAGSARPARALAEAGCEVVINGRDAKTLNATATELSGITGTKITAVVADVATPDGQKLLLAACPQPDILINNNAGPPLRDFRELTRAQMLDGVTANMIVAIELIQKVIDPMMARRFGRIVNITSGAVKAPLAGLDLSSGARGFDRVPRRRRPHRRRQERHHQQYLTGRLRHRPLARHAQQDGRGQG